MSVVLKGIWSFDCTITPKSVNEVGLGGHATLTRPRDPGGLESQFGAHDVNDFACPNFFRRRLSTGRRSAGMLPSNYSEPVVLLFKPSINRDEHIEAALSKI